MIEKGLNHGHDILHTMGGRAFDQRWSEIEVAEDIGLPSSTAHEWLRKLEQLELVKLRDAPRARSGWYLTKLGAGFLAVLQREGKVAA